MAVAIGEFGLLLVLPLFLVNAYGLSTLGAGYVLAVMALGAFASGAAARHVTARFGAPRTVMLGLALEVVGVLAFALYLRPSSAAWLLALLLAIYGLGLGLASAQLTGTVLVDIPTSESGQGSATQSTVRQLGAALGTAILGTVLSLGLAHALTDRLEPVALPPQVESGLVDSTRDSAGGTIPPIREQGDHGRLGPAGPETADALSEGFADATRWSLFVAAGFLAVGLATATDYSTDARRTTTPRPPPRRRRRVGEAPSGERRTWLRREGHSSVGGRICHSSMVAATPSAHATPNAAASRNDPVSDSVTAMTSTASTATPTVWIARTGRRPGCSCTTVVTAPGHRHRHPAAPSTTTTAPTMTFDRIIPYSCSHRDEPRRHDQPHPRSGATKAIRAWRPYVVAYPAASSATARPQMRLLIMSDVCPLNPTIPDDAARVETGQHHQPLRNLGAGPPTEFVVAVAERDDVRWVSIDMFV